MQIDPAPRRGAREGKRLNGPDPAGRGGGHLAARRRRRRRRRCVRAVHRNETGRLADAAREARLPIPVATAIRRELEKRGILTRQQGLAFTAEGEQWLRETLGMGETLSVEMPRDAAGAPLAKARGSRPRARYVSRRSTLDRRHARPGALHGRDGGAPRRADAIDPARWKAAASLSSATTIRWRSPSPCSAACSPARRCRGG